MLPPQSETLHLKYACKYGHVETIEAFMPHLGPDDLKLALYWATSFGSTKVAMAVLRSPDIDINSATRSKPPIFLAAAAHDTTTIRVLLDKRVDVHIMFNYDFDHGGISCLDGNEFKKKYTSLHAFARACNNRSSISKAGLRLKDGFEMLLKAGSDLNVVDGSGSTVLHSLIRVPGVYLFSPHEGESWLKDVISFLLSQGASATALAADGSTLLHNLSGAFSTVVDLLI